MTTPIKRAVRIDHWVEVLAAMCGFAGISAAANLREGGGCGQGDQVGAHDLAHEQDLQRIDGVFAAQVKAAPRHLFGEDRALEQQHGEARAR